MSDYQRRIDLAALSLDGLSVGDALGQRFFGDPGSVQHRITSRRVPPGPWPFTDDSAMAISVVDILRQEGRIEPGALARAFARRYGKDPARGYGEGAHGILSAISRGAHWEQESQAAFGGAGSMGNGGAMRAAPIGAYFYDDEARTVIEADYAAQVTHMHQEGRAGAIAVALAAAWSARRAERARAAVSGSAVPTAGDGTVFEFVLHHLGRHYINAGEVLSGIIRASELSVDTDPAEAARILGSGDLVLARDTVPFCLWVVARGPDNYEDAIWTTLQGLGDRDTTCAIVGGIVVLSASGPGIPAPWLDAREDLSALD